MTRPNILLIMVDQLTGTLFPDGPADFLEVPMLGRLAAEGVRFRSVSCASPLCAPSRASIMTGMLPSSTGVYDNAAEFASSLPTFAHQLRRAGYRTTLIGKMHFVGPDQLHGFEERLTTDIYPADFGWTPDWTRPDERIDWWYHNLGSVTAAGTAEITNQLEYDDEVAALAEQAIRRLARREDGRPFCLTVSFTHPHDPFVARKRFWDLYPDGRLPPPCVPAIPYDRQDAHSKRLFDMSDWRHYEVTPRMVADSRRAYCANLSYLDEKIGILVDTLAACGFGDDTVILFTADHGEMLGERGLWFKMSFFEGSIRVPLLIHAPSRFAPRSIASPVSTLDILPTLAGLAGLAPEPAGELDGMSLVPLASGAAPDDGARPVFAEYAAEGSIAPMVMVRQGALKLVLAPPDPPLLFDLGRDPHERESLAGRPAWQAARERLMRLAGERWNLAAFDRAVRRSQARRLAIYPALRHGAHYPWDFEPLQKASERFMRNHRDLNVVESRARWPRG